VPVHYRMLTAEKISNGSLTIARVCSTADDDAFLASGRRDACYGANQGGARRSAILDSSGKGGRTGMAGRNFAGKDGTQRRLRATRAIRLAESSRKSTYLAAGVAIDRVARGRHRAR